MPTGRASEKKAVKAKKTVKTKDAPKKVGDSVAVDAKRILLRYGAPIATLDKVSEAHRIEFAREIAKTNLPEREKRLRALLLERGYTKPKA
jgi:hypothetical protein